MDDRAFRASPRSRAAEAASPSRVPGGAADGLVVGLAVESLGEERLGVDRRGDILDLVFRGRRAHGRASRLGGALRLGLPLRGRRAELRGEGGTESRHGIRWWCHARGAREAGRVAGWRVECADATPGAMVILVGRACEPQSGQSGFCPGSTGHSVFKNQHKDLSSGTKRGDLIRRRRILRSDVWRAVFDFFHRFTNSFVWEKMPRRDAANAAEQRATPPRLFSPFSMTIAAVRVGRGFTPSSAPFAPLHTQEHGCHDRCPRAPRRSRGDARQPQGHQGPHQNQAQEGASCG